VDKFLLLFIKLKDRGFFHLIVSNYSVQFIVFGSSLLLAKIMSPTDVGIIKTIEIFANMAIVLGGGGVVFAILKVIPEHKESIIRRFSLVYSLKYASIFSLTVYVIFNLVAFSGFVSDDTILVQGFQQYSFIIVPSVLMTLLIRYYQAIDMFKRISKIIFYLKFLSAGFVLWFTYFHFIKGYILSMVITSGLATGVLLVDLRKEFIGKEIANRHIVVKNKILNLSRTAFIAQLIDQLKLHSRFLIANYVILDRVMFGHYAFAFILIQGINIVTSSVQQFIIPKMSKASANLPRFFSKHKKFENQFNLIVVVVFFGAQLLLPILVGVVFGDKYNDAIILLRIMLIGWLFEALCALKGVVFLSLGKMKYISYASFVILLLSCPVIYYLDMYYGGIGAAFAYVFQGFISLIVLTCFTRMVSR